MVKLKLFLNFLLKSLKLKTVQCCITTLADKVIYLLFFFENFAGCANWFLSSMKGC